MQKKGSLILLTLIYILVFSSTNSLAVTPQAIVIGASSRVPVPEISAPSAILVESETGQVLYSKDSQTLLHISSACKLMTILVAIENSDIFANATVSTEAAKMEGSALNLEVGSKYQLNDLLHAIMLTSANDAAIVVAEHVSSGSVNKFINLMNETAEKLNMSNTYFTNPTGLFDERQYTTANDISLLIRYANKNQIFNRIFSTKARPWYSAGNEAEILTSSNQLFWSYDGIEGGKTGYNKKEQQSVISTASRTNIKLISIVLDVPDSKMYSDTIALFNYGFDNFWKSTLVRKGEVLKTADFEGNKVKLISQNDIMYVHPIGDSYIKEFNAIADLKPPLKKTIPVGSAKYILRDGTEVNVSLYPESEIIPQEDTMTKVKKRILENRDIFILVLVLLAIEAILIVFNIGKLIRKLLLIIIKRLRKPKART